MEKSLVQQSLIDKHDMKIGLFSIIGAIGADMWCIYEQPICKVYSGIKFMWLYYKRQHMQQANDRNESKNRKSEAQKHFDAADNAGRFAGNEQDAKAARQEAMEDIESDPDLNNDDPFRDLDEGEAARAEAGEKE